MLGFREGESHTPTPKPALNFNWTGITKRPFTSYACRGQQKQTFGKIYEILSFWKYDIPIGQSNISLGVFFLGDLYFFFRCYIFSEDFRFLSWMTLNY